ncbi:unnamed protein product [Calypogeia fissa]
MRETFSVFLRVLPWLMTTVSANVIHYFSLWIAKEEAHRQVLESTTASHARHSRWYPGSDPEEHERLSFDLMNSPTMRKARYLVKLIRYGCTLLYVALFYNFLPELSIEKFSPGLGTIEALVVGVLGGLVTLYLNENGHLEMRTCWRPDVDYGSQFFGWVWDGIRFAGAFATPVEDALMYHSWIYRSLTCYMTENSYSSFIEVPFLDWNWVACIASNCVFALYNGTEWRSSGLIGILSLWVAGRRGQLLDGILAHATCRVTISTWVLSTGQRQYW